MTVIFDMDGVLFDTEQLIVDCWEQLALKYEIPRIKQTLYQCVGITNEATKQIMLAQYGDDFPFDYYKKEISNLFMSHVRTHGMPMKKGVTTLLSFLKDSGYKIGLASSTRRFRVEEEIFIAQLTEYFDVMICGDMVSKSKPDPEIFLTCAKALNAKPCDCYVVEDSYNGIRAAWEAGMHPLMVPDLLPPTDEMVDKAEKIFKDLIEVKEYIENKGDYR